MTDTVNTTVTLNIPKTLITRIFSEWLTEQITQGQTLTLTGATFRATSGDTLYANLTSVDIMFTTTKTL